MYRLSLALIMVAFFVSRTVAYDVETGLVYRIATDKAEYLPGESILVISTISNASDKVREVRLPAWTFHVVSHSSYRSNEVPRWNHIDTEGEDKSDLPASRYTMIALKPGEKAESSIELLRALFRHHRPLSIDIGTWCLRSRYHFAETDAPNYDRDVLMANEVRFRVVEPNGLQQAEFEEFKSALRENDKEARLRKLTAYAEGHRGGLFRVATLNEIANLAFKKGDDDRYINVLRELLQEKISSCKRSSEASELADRLARQNRFEDAVNVMDDEVVRTNPCYARQRDSLRQKIVAKNKAAPEK